MKIFSLKNFCRLRILVVLIFLGIFTAVFSGLAARSRELFVVTDWQFAPGIFSMVALSGITAASAMILAAVITAYCGRFYCSWICPLGLLQDIIERLDHKFFHRKKVREYRKSHWSLRIIFFVVSALLFFNGFALLMGYLEPYSLFGKISSGIIRQVMSWVNGAVFESEEIEIKATDAWSIYLAVSAGLLLAISALTVWKGRFFCNNICPAGTLLASLTLRSGSRLNIDRSKCVNCRKCEKACNAHCINIAEHKIDFASCFMCLECMSVCPTNAIGMTNRRKSDLKDADLPSDPERRKLLITAGAAGAAAIAAGKAFNTYSPVKNAVLPPGAGSVEEFLARCTGCGLCISNCRGGCLQPAVGEYGWRGFMLPTMKFSGAHPGKCEYECKNCMTNCPTGALRNMSLKNKQRCRIGLAVFNADLCVANIKGQPCGACAEHCPTGALKMVKGPHEYAPIPQVITDLCIGCGNCQYACPTLPQAIIVEPVKRQDQAADPEEYRKKEEVKTPPSSIPF